MTSIATAVAVELIVVLAIFISIIAIVTVLA
jgi:hypothetical protein